MGKVDDVIHGGGHNSMDEVLAHPGIYSGTVIIFSWKMIEAERGVFDFSVVDKTLSEIEQYNDRYPKTPVFAKLRVFTGANAPVWAIRLGGGPMAIRHDVYTRGEIKHVPVFWSDEYVAAWQNFIEKLAERYDDNDLVREVAISSNAMMSAEPFIQPLGDDANLEEYKKFGFSDQVFKDALRRALDDYACWERTPLDYTINPFSYTDGGTRIHDTDFSIELMREFRERYGERAIIANHGLQPNLFNRVVPMYRVMKDLGPPMSFQTYSPSTLTDEAIQLGIQTGANQIELWVSVKGGGTAEFDINDLKRWRGMLDSAKRRQRANPKD